jgi:hypothetical protein
MRSFVGGPRGILGYRQKAFDERNSNPSSFRLGDGRVRAWGRNTQVGSAKSKRDAKKEERKFAGFKWQARRWHKEHRGEGGGGGGGGRGGGRSPLHLGNKVEGASRPDGGLPATPCVFQVVAMLAALDAITQERRHASVKAREHAPSGRARTPSKPRGTPSSCGRWAEALR